VSPRFNKELEQNNPALTDSGSPLHSGRKCNPEERRMATKRPSYLKRLKEQKRNERAREKRDARSARRLAKSSLPVDDNVLEQIQED
jgi:hypothetical protein